MNIDKFKQQHLDILAAIAALRSLAQDGIGENAPRIAAQIVAMSGLIKLHLAVERRYLYPALQTAGNPALARMSRQYQGEMDGIVDAYLAFAGKWNTAPQVAAQPEQFRSDANHVLKTLYQRMQREDREFYPAIEAFDAGRQAA
ncbi:hemerythrin domain-containing protein [Janthinobacterium agaricidamnosum]|uniref:Hemerythrin HHE cation binding protein n=1 Tax=Janthinobacterium agaricidamnosum NBRC 102515 = DSM 9628 TaxID=1349767 RepID=W0V7V8_9BURK|nr:hemerythrin domain-containing protein [Janthinobacterium agaricidamnosum]CDG83357.1 hemerythrin HHE cation binding protein [Janthinobacterium agaricidamnosum NBRC 102515 = DSM 9628]